MVSMLLLALFLPQEPAPAAAILAQDDRFVQIVDMPLPNDLVLEVGGIVARGDELIVATRRGEVWHFADAYGPSPKPTLWAQGLQEPLGLLERDGWLYCAQRGELSRMRDVDGDHRMDELQTVSQGWPLSGNYHEYCFGPTIDGDGRMWLTLNKPFGDEPYGKADWRGWAVRIEADGSWTPVCAGLRSPAGVAASPWGEVFYSDNQGEWCATSKFAALHEGDFHGHPHGIESCKLPASKVAHPGKVPSGQRMEVTAAAIANFRLPAVWIPYDLLGRSPGGFVWDTDGRFPPYRGQVFCGDQYSSEVFRISLDKVDGRWQGACYPFRRGLKCGMTRVQWGTDGSLWCGMTNRGWPSVGPEKWGLQRLVWRGVMPFDLVEVTATRGGFALKFSAPLAAATLVPASFAVQSWTYDHHSDYGCPERDRREQVVTAVRPGATPDAVELQVADLHPVRVYQIRCDGVRDAGDQTVWHPVAWYTLNSLR
ncbi:MAG: hypothetical protein IPK26_04005 [Planctomycetes bacterium]|nr:hypothetical protein [Planctomycetota bacterium]